MISSTQLSLNSTDTKKYTLHLHIYLLKWDRVAWRGAIPINLAIFSDANLRFS